MGSEDFAFLALERKASYLWLGVSELGKESVPVHNPYYDFNDALLPIGASLYVALVEEFLKEKP